MQIKRVVLSMITLLFFLTFEAQCQNQVEADSLSQLLEGGELTDSLRVVYLSRISIVVSSPDKKIEYANDLLLLSTRLGLPKKTIESHYHLGVANRLNGNLEKSFEYFFEGARLAQEEGDFQNLADLFSEIATCYSQNEDSKNAINYSRKAVNIARQLGKNQSFALQLLNLGYDYYNINDLDTALIYYNEAEPIFEETGLEIGKAYTIGNRALVFWKQGDLLAAKNDLLIAIDMLKPLGDQYGMADYYNQLGSISLEQNKNEEAIQYTEIGLEMAKSEDLKEQVRDASMLLSKLYKEQGKYEKSLNYQTQYIAYKDSIQDRETTQRLADLRTDFEVGQKQAELDIVEVQRKNQELISYIIAGILLVILVLAMIVYKNYRQKLALSKELAQINESKNKLFSIISHDLRGPMAAFSGVGFMIKSAMKQKETSFLEDVATHVDKSSKQLSSLLDNLLNWSMQQQGGLSVNHENIGTKQMFEELKETFESQSNIKDIDIEVRDVEDCQINADRNMTYTIFRNLISNALKFTPEKGKIIVSCQAESGHAVIRVKDTGVGMSQEKVSALFQFDSKKSTYGTAGEKGLGLGLQLVHEFVVINGGNIESKSKEGEGTTFIVRLPLFKSA